MCRKPRRFARREASEPVGAVIAQTSSTASIELMASVDVLYETPFPQRSTTRVKNACAWDGTGRLVVALSDGARARGRRTKKRAPHHTNSHP